MKLNDADIIIELQQGRAREAICQLYFQHFALLSRYVFANQGNEADAEDLFQEVLIAFINLVKQNKFRGESSIATFLFAINKNLWLNELKKRGRTAVREEKYGESLITKDPGMELVISNRETERILVDTMKKLGDTCQQILLLYYYEQLSIKEILSKLPFENEQVVRNKKYKCLKKMESLVSENQALYQQLKNYLHG
ncbi:MAG: RNA polymerase sigma factor [Flavisolibacter sp.]